MIFCTNIQLKNSVLHDLAAYTEKKFIFMVKKTLTNKNFIRSTNIDDYCK